MRRKGHQYEPHSYVPCLDMINKKLKGEEKRFLTLKKRLEIKKDQKLKKKEKLKQQRQKKVGKPMKILH